MDPDDKTKRWCSTKVDSNGNHVVKQNQFGHCSKNCPIHNGNSNGNQQQYPPNNQGKGKKIKEKFSKKFSVTFLYAYFLPENLGNGNSNGGQQQHPPNNQGKIQDFQKVYRQTIFF